MTKETGRLRRSNFQYWQEIKEKSKQLKYKEDFSKINRKTGEKRKRSTLEQEEKERRNKEKIEKMKAIMKARVESQKKRVRKRESCVDGLAPGRQ